MSHLERGGWQFPELQPVVSGEMALVAKTAALTDGQDGRPLVGVIQQVPRLLEPIVFQEFHRGRAPLFRKRLEQRTRATLCGCDQVRNGYRLGPVGEDEILSPRELPG